MIELRSTDKGWEVVHEDGTILYAGDKTEAHFRFGLLSKLAARLRDVTGGMLAGLWPTAAPRPLVLSAEEQGVPVMTYRPDGEADGETTYTITNHEILRSGVVLKLTSDGWRKFTIPASDVLSIVEAFAALRWEPPYKIGHNRIQPELDGLPSIGRAFGVRAVEVGDAIALHADFKRVPQRVVDAMRGGSLYQVSVELFHDVPRVDGDGVYPVVLKAVSLLGEDLPAVRGMRPADAMVPAFSVAGAVSILTTQTGDTMSEKPEDRVEPKAEVVSIPKSEWEKVSRALAAVEGERETRDNEIKALQAQLGAMRGAQRGIKAESFVKDMVRDGHLTPATEVRALELLKTLADEDECVTFSTVKDGQAVEQKMTQYAAFQSFIRELPKSAGAPGAAATRGGNGETPGVKTFGAMNPEEQAEAVEVEYRRLVKELGNEPEDYTEILALTKKAQNNCQNGGK